MYLRKPVLLVETVKMAVHVIEEMDDVTMPVKNSGPGTHVNVCSILSHESGMNSIG